MFKRLRFQEFVIISLMLHGLTVLIMSLPKMKPKKDEVVIEILDQKPVPKKQALRPAEMKKPKPIPDQQKQIVEQDEKKTNEEAPDTRFLSAQNQKVLKQTIAKKKGVFKNAKKEALSPNEAKEASSWSLAPKINDPVPLPVADDGIKKVEQTKTAEESDKKADVASGSQTNDYLKDVDQGLETLLNAREFKYYTYYNRIRRQLTQHWEPKVRSKLSALFKAGRTIASDTDRVTKLIVVLDKNGNLVKVQVLKESGVSDLDDAATESFRSAAPFPNPPSGIIESDGTVKIRWDFVLEG